MVISARKTSVVGLVVGVAAFACLCHPQDSARAVTAAAAAPATSFPESQELFDKTIVPLLRQNCYQCHANGQNKGEVALDSYKTIADVEQDRAVWKEVLKDVRTGVMPQAASTHKPSPADRKTIADWIERELYKFDPNNPYPGRVTLHRLNRAEYNNTVRDLLATDLRPADTFPNDDAGYGFDNNGDVLSMAPVLMEKYIQAAKMVLDDAIFSDPVVPAPVAHWDAATLAGTIPPADPNAHTPPAGPLGRTSPLGRVFNYAGRISTTYTCPADGHYDLRFRGYGRQLPRVQFQIDGQNIDQPVEVTDDLPNVRVYGIDKAPLTAGKHVLTLVFVNGPTKQEYDAASAAAAVAAANAKAQPAGAVGQTQTLPQGRSQFSTDGNGPAPSNGPTTRPTTNPSGRAAGRGRRNGRGPRGSTGGVPGKPLLGVIFVEVEGPVDITPDRMSESYRRVFVSYPSAKVTKQQAAAAIIRNFAPRAFRRPVAPAELAEFMAVWSRQNAAGESFESSIDTALQAVLISPYFLYRYEKDPSSSDPNAVRTLDEYELASRLSYFLWSSMPDDELFHLAGQGKLRANLETQVRRMMADPKSSAMVENFAGQWLQLRQMYNVSPDPNRYPAFDEDLRAAMIKETQLYFSSIMTGDRSVLEFIDSDYTFMNERLAKHYGRTDVLGDQFRKVMLTGKQRGGLVTQASVLTITSYANRTSPVQRGKWVLENLLDAAPPPPPPDVPKLAETTQAELSGTLRQRMEQHRTNPNCVTCHAQMDPIGFGLENYDAIGAWRDRDINNVIIDASGTLPDGETFDGAAGLKAILMSRKDEFCRCLTDRMLTYALGRGTEAYDRPMEDKIALGLKQQNYKFSALVMQIVECVAFQKRGALRGDL
jgi:mono/diheme cytochrome c family protein